MEHKNFKNRIGEKYTTYQNYEVEIIEYFGARNCTIRFNDERGTTRKNVAIKELKSGSVKNLFHRDVIGVGYIGEGEFTARVNGEMTKCYNTWVNMLSRCYNVDNNRNDSYSDVNVCEDWLCFQNFAKWFYSEYDPIIMKNWHLDKDLLCYTCREYSANNCCLIPNKLNVLFKDSNQSTTDLPRGVYPKDGKYQSSINKFGKQCYIGFYETIEETHYAYLKAKKEYFLEISEIWRGILQDKICNAIRDFDVKLL